MCIFGAKFIGIILLFGNGFFSLYVQNGIGGEIEIAAYNDGMWLQVLSGAMNHSTVYSLNFWFQYAKYIAQIQNRSNCYFCTQMPIAASNPHVTLVPVRNSIDFFPKILVSSLTPELLNDTIRHTTGQNLPKTLQPIAKQFEKLKMTNET